jgi:hypothetical protein
MVKYIAATQLNETADYQFTRWSIVIPQNIEFEELFVPVTWAHVRHKLTKNDIVRVIAQDGSYDIDLTVRQVEVGGVHMLVRPHLDGIAGADALKNAAERAKDAAPKVVPLDGEGNPVVKVQYLPATQWRVIGINGGEVSRNHASEADAIDAMNAYLASSGLTMPSLGSREPAKKTARKKETA